MDEYDYESDSYDEDAYDEELDAEPFFGNLLKSQTQIEEEEGKGKRERESSKGTRRTAKVAKNC